MNPIQELINDLDEKISLLAQARAVLADRFTVPTTSVVKESFTTGLAKGVQAPAREIEKQKVSKAPRRPRQAKPILVENGSVSDLYRKEMHPEMAANQPAPEKEGRGGRFSPDAVQVIDAMRGVNEPFKAADLERATGGLDTDFGNHIYRALDRGWINRAGRGQYTRTESFPAEPLTAAE